MNKLTVAENSVFQHLLSTYCVPNIALCVRNAMLTTLTQKVELLNPRTVSMLTSHDKFHARKRKTQDPRNLRRAREAEGSSRGSLGVSSAPHSGDRPSERSEEGPQEMGKGGLDVPKGDGGESGNGT